MGKLKKQWKKIIIIFLVLAAICLGTQYQYLKFNPFQPWTASMLSLAVSNKNGETIVVDHSGKQISKINADRKVEFVQEGKKGQKNCFYEARDLAMDSKGNYYVLDIQRRESGRWIELERILKYNADGKFEKVIAERQYGEHEIVLKNRINRIEVKNDTLYYYVFSERGFELCNEQGTIKKYKYSNAELMLVDFAYNVKNGESAVLTKKGEILKTNGESFQTIVPTTIDNKGMNHVPWHGTYDEEGNFYYIDIGTRTIYKITEDGTIEAYFSNDVRTKEEFPELEIMKTAMTYYILSHSGELMTINADLDQIVRIHDKEVLIEKQYAWTSFLQMKILFTLSCAIILSIALVIIVVYFIKYLKENKNIKLRIITGCIVGAVGLTSIFTMLVMKNWTNQMTNEVTKRAASMGQTLADMISGDSLGKIHQVDDYMNPDYQKIRTTIRSILAQDEAYAKDFYCVLYRIQDGMTTAAYSIEDYSGAFYPYAGTAMTEQMISTFASGEQLLSVSTTSEGIFLFSMTPVYDSMGNGVGLLEVGTNMYEFQMNNYKMIFEIILNAVVIAIMVILVIFEMLVYGEGKEKYRAKQISSKKNKVEIPVIMTRMFIFVMCFATSMTRGFIPLFVMKQSKVEDLFGLSYEILLSIALAAEVLFNAIFAFAGDKIVRKMGRRKAAILGSILFVVGMSLRAIFPTILCLIIGNSIMGAGAGILVLVVQVMLAESQGIEKDEGFAGFTAGSLSGANCGVVFGAFLINWLNYQAIFFVVALISFYLLWFVFHFIYDSSAESEIIETKEVQAEKAKISIVRFLSSPRIISYYIGIVIPMVAAGYFLTYLFPILASGYGMSETNIGYACLLNGLCIICFGNGLIRYLNKRVKYYQSISISAIFYASAFVIFAIWPSLLTLFLTLILLGLADGFGMPIQGSYYTTLKEVEQYGYDRSMAVYSLLENLSQVGGSFLFSAILMGGVSKGLLIGGICLISFAIVFNLINRIMEQKAISIFKD